MKKITLYSNDQIVFNPDCVFIERGKWNNYNARIVAKKGLDYYILLEYETYEEAKKELNDMYKGIVKNYEGLFFKETEME